MVFQSFNLLLPKLTLGKKTVRPPRVLQGHPPARARQEAEALAGGGGSSARQGDKYSHQVAGGEMQRAAIARPYNQPAVIRPTSPRENRIPSPRPKYWNSSHTCTTNGQTIILGRSHARSREPAAHRALRARWPAAA